MVCIIAGQIKFKKMVKEQVPDVVAGREETGHVLCNVFLIFRCVVLGFYPEHNQKEKHKNDWKSGLSFIFFKMYLIAQVSGLFLVKITLLCILCVK